MVHKVSPKQQDLIKAIVAEGEKDKAWVNQQFQRLPLSAQYFLESGKDVMGAEWVFPFRARGEEKMEKKGIRYGVIGVNKNHLLLGNIKPIGQDRAEVYLREVFP